MREREEGKEKERERTRKWFIFTVAKCVCFKLSWSYPLCESGRMSERKLRERKVTARQEGVTQEGTFKT